MAEPESPLSKRKYPRRNFFRHISVLSKGDYYMGKGREVGEGGMLIEFEKELANNALILVNFMVEDAILSVQCEVRSISEVGGSYQYGLLFLNLPYDGKKAIREYIAAKSEEESLAEMRMAQEAS